MPQIISQNATIWLPTGASNQSISVLVFYPGIAVNGAIGKSYMPPLIKAAVPDWFDKYVIVIPNTHMSDWGQVKSEYTIAMEKANLKEKDLSIGIFSGSGNQNSSIQINLATIKVLNLMLMDPTSTGKIVQNVKTLKANGTNCYLTYNPANWGRYPAIKAGFTRLAQEVGQLARLDKVSHMKIPGTLLTTWKSQIESTLTGASQMNPIKENNKTIMKLNECNCGCGGNGSECGDSGKDLNYMFFGNLETIKRMIDELIEMDPSQIDMTLKDGHDWAVDHIASSTDDIQEVFNFIKGRIGNRKDRFAEPTEYLKTFENFLKLD